MLYENKNSLFRTIFIKLISLLPTRKRIVFESNPEFSCNTYPIYKYLIDEFHIDDEYEIVWLVKDKKKYDKSKYKNTRFVEYAPQDSSILKKIIYMYYLVSSKALIYSNRLLGKYKKNQFSFCVMHGMPLKATSKVYRIDNECDAVICISEFFTKNIVEGFGADEDKLVYLDFARNDYLFSQRDVLKKLGLDSFSKVIIWTPTYRQHDLLPFYNLEETPTTLPILTSFDSIDKMNAFLKNKNCLLLIKPHPAQLKRLPKELLHSNITVVSNGKLRKNEIQLNELLGQVDAMITDYSTIYYDFLLTGKPIGLTDDDIEEYEEKRGFFYKNLNDVLKGHKIDNISDMEKFIENVCKNIDEYKEVRQKICDLVHPHYSTETTKKTAEYIIKNLRR
jgi:CDP-glycerol glycerophosphotransferase (TagB/SpsB family)